ncbi:MAG: phenylacetate--CoA ligase family protein [Desulfobacteraceae bacterium]|nr:MAG: phenylacetate--CoA ligase family protein [Desulfobacteraceae bacterium]
MSFIPYDLNDDKLKKIQLQGLKWTVGHAYNNSPFYKKKLADAGLKPEDIRSLEDIEHLPLIDKDDLQQGYPFPLRAVPFEDIVRIHASSGTTGKRKVLCYTQKDIDVWADIFARCYELAGLTREDRVQIAVGYGLWTAGVGFQAGCERFGAMAVPLGPANAEMHCEMMVDMGTTVFCSTASMALLMAEEIHKRNLLSSIKVKKIILGAERHSDAMRNRIKELMGVEHIFDIYGLTELYGPGTGLDCSRHNGIHYWADHFIFEILDPETLRPVPYGQQGELVVTTLSKEGSPLIRYRTHDVTRLFNQKCSCGVPLPMHDRILGRTDDMFTYRAVNIYPSQIDHVLSRVDGIGSEFQIHLKQESGRDMMLVKVERAIGVEKTDDIHIAERVALEIRRKILVRCQIEIVDPGYLPRTQKKSQRVFDHRNEK